MPHNRTVLILKSMMALHKLHKPCSNNSCAHLHHACCAYAQACCIHEDSVFNCTIEKLAPRQTLYSKESYNQNLHWHKLLNSAPAACLCQPFVEYDTLQKHEPAHTYITLRNSASCLSVRPASCSVSALCACNCLRGNCDIRWYVPGFISGATVTSTQSKSVCNFCVRANLQARREYQHQIIILPCRCHAVNSWQTPHARHQLVACISHVTDGCAAVPAP